MNKMEKEKYNYTANSRKWDSKNKIRSAYTKYKGSAKNFITKKACHNDLVLFKQFIDETIQNKFPDWRKLKEQGISYDYYDLIYEFNAALNARDFTKGDSIAVVRRDIGFGYKPIVKFSNYKNLDSVILEDNEFIDYVVASVILEELEGMNNII